jgi:hypothetical protein
MLATFDVPFDREAAAVAVDAAVESGLPLIVCNSVQLPPMPLSIVMGYDQLEYPPAMEESLVAPVRLAASLGVRVERIRVRSLRPLEALLQVAGERRLGLLVLGPDRTRLSRRRYERIARAIRDAAPCLIWLAEGTD